MDYSKLQNGSDIRGIAMENETGPVNLTDDAVRHLAAAFAVWLKGKLNKDSLKIAVGHDSRLTGELFVNAAIEGLNSEGCSCADCGLASTPAMFMTTVTEGYNYDGSIMITASHLPWYRNGMKFFTAHGGLESSDIKELTAIAGKTEISVPLNNNAEKLDFMTVYSDHLCETIKNAVKADDFEHPLKGLHIIVDAGNGDGGFYVSKVLEPLGADTTGSQFLEPDGHFPNHIPNPENKEAAEAIKNATLASKADLGIIFDTDVDRAGAILPSGRELTRNALIAVLSRIALSEQPGTTIVTDSVTSTGLAEFITSHGGVHRRFKRGYKNVIDESIRLNNEGTDSQLAIETSGHGAFKENYFLDDGAYLMVKLLVELGKGHKLDEMIADLKEPVESIELRFPVLAENVSLISDKILETIKAAVPLTNGWSLAPDNFEGVRINVDADHGNGWLLLRKSLHEPIMPLNIESDEEGGCSIIARTLYELLKPETTLDLQSIIDFIGRSL